MERPCGLCSGLRPRKEGGLRWGSHGCVGAETGQSAAGLPEGPRAVPHPLGQRCSEWTGREQIWCRALLTLDHMGTGAFILAKGLTATP